MKRIGNLYEKIISLDNLRLADKNARKGKYKQKGVIIHSKNREENIQKLHKILIEKKFKTSRYSSFIIHEEKEREIFVLPYYPDRILHHAILQIISPILLKCFISQTYSCIRKRGIHKCLKDIKLTLKDTVNTRYCLKLDIRKFYPSINKDILKKLLRKKFKDLDLLTLLDEIIDSNVKGLPIGNYLSQWLSNFYLTYFDHWIKEIKRMKNYFRYMDDIAILCSNKLKLHKLLSEIKEYLKLNLNLNLSNYQVFPISIRGLDMVGYKSYPNYTLLRKRIKLNFKRMLKNNPNKASINSYLGWTKHANCRNLENKLLK